MAQQIQFTDEAIYPDGGYVATARLYGFEFAISYSNGTVKAHGLNGTSYYRGSKYRGTQISAAKRVIREITDKLMAMPEHRAAHLEMMAVDD